MTKNRPVLYLLSAYPVRSQTFVRNEVQALRATGVDVRVIALNDGDAAVVDPQWAGPSTVAAVQPVGRAVRALLWWAARHPVRLVRFLVLFARLGLRGGRTAFRALPAALRDVEQDGGVTAVHTHFGWRAAGPCLLAGTLMAAPTSVTLHANDIYIPSADLGRKLRRFGRLVTVCRYNVGVIESLTDRPPPLHIVPCGVDIPAGPTAPVTGAHLLSVGRIVPKKGFLDLVEAFGHVAGSRPDARLTIVGDGPDRDELTAAVSRSPHADRITLTGPLPHEDVLAMMAACSVFVLACRPEPSGGSDALPVVIREAMAYGRPVVSTSLAGIPETLEGVGWLARPGDVAGLADALGAALDPGPEPARRGRLARERVQQHYTLGHTAEGMRHVFGLPTTSTSENGQPCAS